MTASELAALPVMTPADPAIQRATWFEDDDPMQFIDRAGASWRLHQTAAGDWVRVRC